MAEVQAKAAAEQKPGLVSLVGAGPGDPGLLTLRALECLAEAELVVYDQLVPPRLLDYAAPTAERRCVRELAPCHGTRLRLVVEVLIAAARQGRRVVRLKGGDPFLFGRGGEEAEALRQAGIPYEVVPGVTAALGAASAGIPLTHRDHASAVALVTGHEDPLKRESSLDWEVLARFPGTLVIYMGRSRLSAVVQALLAQGRSPETPVAVIHWATTGRQQTVTAPLGQIAAVVQQAGLTAPVVVIVGAVVSLREQLAWREQLPLFGKGVLLTRPRGQALALARQLEQLGAAVWLLPVIEVAEPLDWGPVDRALEQLSSYHWLVFTSANGVHALLRRLRQRGQDLRALAGVRLAAIGPRTAETLRSYHLEPDLVPPRYCSEELAAALAPRVAGQRVLLARADRGRDVLPRLLAEVAQVEQIAVYRQCDLVQADPAVLEALRQGAIHYVTLTSPSIARAFVALLDPDSRRLLEQRQVQLVALSPVTGAALRELGLPVAAEAQEYTQAGLVTALLHLARSDSSK